MLKFCFCNLDIWGTAWPTLNSWLVFSFTELWKHASLLSHSRVGLEKPSAWPVPLHWRWPARPGALRVSSLLCSPPAFLGCLRVGHSGLLFPGAPWASSFWASASLLFPWSFLGPQFSVSALLCYFALLFAGLWLSAVPCGFVSPPCCRAFLAARASLRRFLLLIMLLPLFGVLC